MRASASRARWLADAATAAMFELGATSLSSAIHRQDDGAVQYLRLGPMTRRVVHHYVYTRRVFRTARLSAVALGLLWHL
jgi:hypothetical protein